MIRELFEEVLNNYLSEKKKPYSGTGLAEVLRRRIPDALKEKSSLTDAYIIRGSQGSGNWAEIPWVAVLDKEITDTTQNGYYIVYLFDAEMNGVYLSLNQGWTQYEEKYKSQPLARKAITEKTLQLQQVLDSSFDFSKLPINLHVKNNLGKGYQLGNIAGKFYPKDALPNDIHIIDDLRNLIGVYRELRGKAGVYLLDFEIPVDRISEIPLPLPQHIEMKELVLQSIEPTERKYAQTNKPLLFDVEKNLNNQKKNRKTGETAEKIVLKAEQERLINLGRVELSEKVKIISEDMSLGFDILSYDEDGTERQIEVKGSTSEDLFAFHLSANELEKSKKLPNYYLYVVHGVGRTNTEVKFFHAPQFLSEQFDVLPVQYLVRYLPIKQN
jgi:hypothetical protein